MKNEHLASMYRALGFPGMAERAVRGDDMSLSVYSVIVGGNISNDLMRGTALLVEHAARKDGYDPEQIAADIKSRRFRPAQAKSE